MYRMNTFVGCLSVVLLVNGVHSLDNGVGLTPPMGFNPWNAFGCSARHTPKLPGGPCGFTQDSMTGVAQAMSKLGLVKAGYEYFNLDCGYTTGFRNADGSLQINETAFPDIKTFGTKTIPSLGLKFGIYTAGGTAQDCSRSHTNATDGIDKHWDQDVASFMSWGVEFLKLDHDGFSGDETYERTRDALNKTGVPVYLSIHRDLKPQPGLSNCWRTTNDINNAWSTILDRAHTNNQWWASSKPGAVNDPDMLEVGNPGLTDVEGQTHFSLWCIMAAPLMIGTDLRKASQATVDTLSNAHAIAVNQDPLVVQGKIVAGTPNWEVWSRPLDGGKYAALMINLSDEPQQTISLSLSDLWDKSGSKPASDAKFTVFDVWAGKNVGTVSSSSNYTTSPQSHEGRFITLTPM